MLRHAKHRGFWNASTRPSLVRGGFGLTIAATHDRITKIERRVEMLGDSPLVYAIWKRLVVSRRISGKQVHDCRLVVLMNVYGIADSLTLNPDDFRRYDGLRVHTPATVLA